MNKDWDDEQYSQLSLPSFFSLPVHSQGTGGPSEVREGRDALLTCVVMAPFYNDTIIWKKGPREILSAGMNRVTSDRRISILHEDCKYPSFHSSTSSLP